MSKDKALDQAVNRLERCVVSNLLQKKFPVKAMEITDTIINSYWDTLALVFGHIETLSYSDKIAMLTASSTIDLERKKEDIEKKRIITDANRILDDFSKIHRDHVTTFWEYIERIDEVTWENHKDFFRERWETWMQKAARTVSLIQTKAELCIEELAQYKIKYARKAELKKLSKLTLEQLSKAWEQKKDPITGKKLNY